MYKTSREPDYPIAWHCCKVCTCSPLLVPDKGKCLQEQTPPSSALHLSPAPVFTDATPYNTAYSSSWESVHDITKKANLLTAQAKKVKPAKKRDSYPSCAHLFCFSSP